MNKTDFSHLMPNIPRGSGLTKRFLWALILGLASLFLVFLYFMHHYSPKPITLQHEVEKINSLEAENLISEAQIQVSHQKQERREENGKTLTPTHAAHLDKVNDAFLSEAAQSAIAITTSPPSTQSANHAAPPNIDSSASDLGLKFPQPYSQNEYKQQNQQAEKKAFLDTAAKTSSSQITGAFNRPTSPYLLTAGTLIPATLQTGIQSDLPGTIIAKVRRNVFDTATGNYLLIPQGTTLVGVYDSQVSYGQNRVLIAWQRLIFPNGSSQDLAGQAGVDLMGLAGLHDQIDNHYARLFSSALLFSLFGTASQLTQAPSSNNEANPTQLLGNSLVQQLSQTGAKLVKRNMNIQPTINIRPGDNFNVLLSRDLVLPTPYSFSDEAFNQ